MKKVTILALHLAYGGVEKAIISMANLFAEKYDVEIISVYNMPDSPAFPLNERVKVSYLLDTVPNREEWKAAVRNKKPAAFVRESIKAVKILANKKRSVIDAIKSVKEGVLITTRHEDNLVLSKYGNKNVFKIAQLHHDHCFEKKYVKGFRHYGNIDVFALLTPGLAEEAREMMKGNEHTKVISIPNFLERYPDLSHVGEREKTVISVGRLDPVKGFDRLIRIFASVHEKEPDWKLKIIGEGEDRGRLQHIIEEYKLSDSVILTGSMDSFKLENEMKKASIFAMTSHSEGFGFVIIEAQSCSLPPLVFDVRVGARMIITDGENGFLIPDRDETAFVHKLHELMDNPELCREIGRKAEKRAQDFSRENVSKIWFSVLGE